MITAPDLEGFQAPTNLRPVPFLRPPATALGSKDRLRAVNELSRPVRAFRRTGAESGDLE